MTTNKPIASRRRVECGFTLIELLVVIVIIGIIVTITTLSVDLRSPSDVLQRDVARFQALLNLICDEAVMEGREMGIRFDELGYQFLKFDPVDGWAPVSTDKVYRQRRLSTGVTLQLTIEGRPIVLSEDTEARQPHLVCYSSAEMSPFSIDMKIQNVDQFVRIKGLFSGALSVEQKNG